MNPFYADKPRDYGARRVWQLAQQAAGIPIECGREACHTRGASYVGSGTGTALYYCAACAEAINRWNPGTCEHVLKPIGPEDIDPFDDTDGTPDPRQTPPEVQAATMNRAARRRERVRARNLKNLEQR